MKLGTDDVHDFSPYKCGSLRLAMFGLFGIGNLGNDATLEAMLHEIRRRTPDAELYCVCHVLPPCATKAGVKWIPIDPVQVRGMWRLKLRTLRNCYAALARILTSPVRRHRIARHLVGMDAMLVVGTGVLDDFGASPWQLPAWLHSWCTGAIRAGANVHFVAVGAGPIRSALNRLLMFRAARTASSRSFRDHVSRDYLAGAGIDTFADPVVPDLVFGLVDHDTNAYPRPHCPARTVGLGVMGYYGWRASPRSGREIYQRYISQLAAFARQLLDRGYHIRVLIGELETDEAAVDDLFRSLQVSRGTSITRGIVASPISTFGQLLAEIANVDVVVATRYHNIVAALALGRPAIALGYASKFDAVMTAAGLGDYCQDVEQIELHSLVAQFERLVRDADHTMPLLRARSSQFRAELVAHFDSLFDTLCRRSTFRSCS